MKRNWTEKQRKIQACNLRRRKIWARSTGPTSLEGKAASSQNALKHGHYGQEMAEIRAVLRLQRTCLKGLRGTLKSLE